jgi:hypothetical protein
MKNKNRVVFFVSVLFVCAALPGSMGHAKAAAAVKNIQATAYNKSQSTIGISVDGTAKCSIAAGSSCTFATTTGKHLFYYSNSDGRYISDNNTVPESWDELCIEFTDKRVDYDDCDF